MESYSGKSSTTHFTCFDSKLLTPSGDICIIGSGSLGGKAQGLVSSRQALISNLDPADFPGISVDIPQMAVIGTDAFDAFIHQNGLEEIVTICV